MSIFYEIEFAKYILPYQQISRYMKLSIEAVAEIAKKIN